MYYTKYVLLYLSATKSKYIEYKIRIGQKERKLQVSIYHSHIFANKVNEMAYSNKNNFP